MADDVSCPALAAPPLINRLPVEILLQIFQRSYALLDYEPWYRLLWVCRFWRGLVQNCPSLWGTITLKKNFKQDFLEASLRFSGAVPLDLTVRGTSSARNLALVEALLPHLARIRSLHVQEMGDVKNEALKTLLHEKMPMLEELSANFKTKTRPLGPYPIDEAMLLPGLHDPEEPFVWHLSPEQFPRLRCLSLGTGLMINGQLPVFPGLRRLGLRECASAPMTVVDFAQYLSQHPRLEELAMYRFRPAVVPVPAPMSFPPSLRKFTLEDHSYYTAPFLSPFFLPPHVDVKIVRLLDYMDTGDFPEGQWAISPTVQDALPQVLGTLPILAEVSSIELRHYMSSYYSVLGTTPAGHTVRLTSNVRDSEGCDEEEFDSFFDLIDVFDGAPVVELFVNGNGDKSVDEGHWGAAFEAFSLLERIVIDRTGSLSDDDARLGLLKALEPVRHKKNAMASSGDPPAAVPAPQLKSLVMTSSAYNKEDKEFSKVLARCLKKRKEHGAQLEKLHLKLEYLARPEMEKEMEGDNARRYKMYTKALRSLVRDLHVEVVNDFYPRDYTPDYED
ncbi:hypothetical protein OH77DRAFT_1437538 [Trametes cingulata]|nr:hypothetical protein OH77DRAFT_1437538 [Trametes cingulata]